MLDKAKEAPTPVKRPSTKFLSGPAKPKKDKDERPARGMRFETAKGKSEGQMLGPGITK